MRIAVVHFLCLLFTFPVFSNPIVHTGALPDWLTIIHPDQTRQPSQEDISEGFYFELLDLQTNLLHNTEYTHFIKHIINESGVQDQSEVSVTFSPQFQQVVFHKVCILRDGAVLDQLEPSRIKIVQEETDANEFEYNGLNRAFITLKDVRKGDRLEVSWSIIGFNPVFGKKYSAAHYFIRSTAVCNYFRTIISSPDRPLLIATRNNAPAPEEKKDGDRLVYRWINPPLKNSESESNTPSWYDADPVVYITEYKTWQEVVDWGLKTFNHYQYPLPAALQQKMTDWRKTAAGNKDIFANLATRFVQNDIRYLGLEIGANTHRPHAPAEVFAGRFGDCKDKALLLSVILQHEGIPACAALINTSAGHILPEVSPSPGQFDHVIVAIQRPAGAWLYVDPTISGQRGELTNLYVPAYGYTLLLHEGEDSLRSVTPGLHYDYYIHEQLDARFYDTSRFTVTTTFTGGAADKTRTMFAESSRKDIVESYIKYYSTYLEGIRQQQPVDYSDDSLKNELTVKEYYAVPSLWKIDKAGKKSFDFAAKVLSDYLSNPSDAPSDAPMALTWPLHVHYTLRLILPEEWNFNSGELHIKNDAYQFDFTPEISGKEMTLSYNLKTFGDHISSADIQQYKTDYKNIEDRLFFTLYKDKTEAAPDPPTETAHTRTSSTSLEGGSSKPCWPAIWLSFFYTLLFSRLFVYLNARSEETLYAPGSGYPLGGWIIVLGLSIAAGLVIDTFQLLRANFYSFDNWAAYGRAGGSALQYLYLGQLAIQLNFIAGAAAVLYWFLKKRDIFPRMFIWYAVIVLSGRLLLFALFHMTPVPAALESYRADLPWACVRTSVYAAIWVSYILRSGQVKSTFLEPFRGDIR
jgi:transglutaminase-like putative cysteine protease